MNALTVLELLTLRVLFRGRSELQLRREQELHRLHELTPDYKVVVVKSHQNWKYVAPSIKKCWWTITPVYAPLIYKKKH